MTRRPPIDDWPTRDRDEPAAEAEAEPAPKAEAERAHVATADEIIMSGKLARGEVVRLPPEGALPARYSPQARNGELRSCRNDRLARLVASSF